jgi:carbonic anhydrase
MFSALAAAQAGAAPPYSRSRGLEIDLAKLLPAERRYYDFEGSLTTPPCSEGVHWMVLTQPVTVSPQAIRAFRNLYPANARPVQPLNGRKVRVAS